MMNQKKLEANGLLPDFPNRRMVRRVLRPNRSAKFYRTAYEKALKLVATNTNTDAF